MIAMVAMESPSPVIVRPVADSDCRWIAELTSRHWGADYVVVHGVVYEPHRLDGFVAVEPSGRSVGLVTYSISAGACEVVTLNSLSEGLGVGTALLEAVESAALAAGCSRVWLITTNDNLRALRFYQKRGYELVAVHRGALERSRRLKPSIPLVSADGIPLRDEIELEHRLDAKTR